MHEEVSLHKSVMLTEIIECFEFNAPLKIHSRSFIDATVGAGGHSYEIVKRGGKLLGIEADSEMIFYALGKLSRACPARKHNFASCFKLVQGNFRDIGTIARGANFTNVDGILFDLGISSVHLDNDERGFSFRNPLSALDMRLDIGSQNITASDFLNSFPKNKLREVFLATMPSFEVNRLVKQILNLRTQRKIESVGDFLEIIAASRLPTHKINVATRPFLALRMAVNSEVSNLEEALPRAYELLKPWGKLAIITFHSTEDRLVKLFFGKNQEVIKVSEKEAFENPRARSAKLRILTKK